jgi:hypothetical protein
MVLANFQRLRVPAPQPWFKTFIFLRVPFEAIKKLPPPINEENTTAFSKSICKPI